MVVRKQVREIGLSDAERNEASAKEQRDKVAQLNLSHRRIKEIARTVFGCRRGLRCAGYN
jgi:hypothetical protein